MPQPAPYDRRYDFAGFSTSNPSDQQPGSQIDGELNAVKATLDAILANLVLIQRDDGRLANGVASLDTLAADVLAMLGSAQGGWVPRGAWVTATAYNVGDVVVNTSTYVCAETHVSGTFATDLADSKWVTLFAVQTSTVPNGSVGTTKIVDGAVTFPKLGFTSLSLSGTMTGVGGLSAGSEVAGTYALGVKFDTGDVHISAARETRDQGSVAVRLAGGADGSVWTLGQAADSDDFTFSSSLSGKTPAKVYDLGNVNFNYTVRVSGEQTPVDGAGLEFRYASSVSYVASYDRDSTTWKALKLQGSTVAISASSVDVLTATSTGVALTEGTVGGQLIGYRDVPQVTKSAAYTLALTDRSKHISISTGGIIIPANATVAFPIGSRVFIYNDSATAQNISITTDTLRHEGGTITGTWSIQPYAMVELVKVKSTTWLARGEVSMAKDGASGFKRYADGTYEMWGSMTANGDGSTTFNYTTIDARISLVSYSRAVVSGGKQDAGAQDNDPFVSACTTTGFTVFSARDESNTVFFTARGR